MEKHGISSEFAKYLPKIGYITMLNDQPIAAGFLRRMEGPYAQLENLISNPYFGSQVRHNGITLVVQALLDEAKSLKLKGVWAFTTDESIIRRSKTVGFVETPQILLINSLQ